MGKFIIEGGLGLKGEITPQGAKNEALQILCATLLTSEPLTIHNLPRIKDVLLLIQLLRDLGVETKQLSEHSYRFRAKEVDLNYFRTENYLQQSASLRGSVMILGPLLARFGQAVLPKPGGDKIGRRRLDTHFLGFQALGATFDFDHAENFYRVHASRLRGTYMHLDEASVTGTANIIMASVLAEGKTTIYNGVAQLGGTEHSILPDMIEVGSFIGMAAMTRSELTIKDVAFEQLGIIPGSFQRLGITLERRGDDLYIPAMDHYTVETFIDGAIMTIADAPWPGLTPDLLSVILVTATQAKGSVLIHQKMFESRLFFVDKLIDMGAQIILCDPHRATVIGLDHTIRLRSTTMSSPDIRAGVALLIAAMSAEGTSIINNIEQIDRGYENIDARLNHLGASIRREP